MTVIAGFLVVSIAIGLRSYRKGTELPFPLLLVISVLLVLALYSQRLVS